MYPVFNQDCLLWPRTDVCVRGAQTRACDEAHRHERGTRLLGLGLQSLQRENDLCQESPFAYLTSLSEPPSDIDVSSLLWLKKL